jgi:3-hydroxybutyryl-CoA dehydrogenase
MTDINVIGIVGAGPMGAGIAQTALASGFSVILLDLNREALQKARDEILARLKRLVEKGKLSADFVVQAGARLTLADSIADFAGKR